MLNRTCGSHAQDEVLIPGRGLHSHAHAPACSARWVDQSPPNKWAWLHRWLDKVPCSWPG
jgi:hypothetical protein